MIDLCNNLYVGKRHEGSLSLSPSLIDLASFAINLILNICIHEDALCEYKRNNVTLWMTNRKTTQGTQKDPYEPP